MSVSSADYVEQRHQGIAPVWHTCILIAATVALGIVAVAGSLPAYIPRAVPFYLGAIAFEWILFAYVWWGIRMRRYPLAALISRGRTTWFKRDIVYGVGIWICWYIVESLVALGLYRGGLTAVASGAIFPHGPVQITLWVIMAASSGFAEEIAFRGYLLQQFSRWTGNVTVGIVVQAILFGIGHTYLGMRQMLLIMVSGALLGIFAAWLRNLRPVMVAHAWADIFGGIIVHGLPYK